MSKKVKQVLQALLFLGIGIVILYLVYRQQNAAYQAQCALDGIASEDCSLILKVWNDFKSVKLVWIAVIIGLFLLSNISRALRWNMLFRPMGYKPSLFNNFLAIMLGYFANLGFPRIGEVVRAGTLSKYEKIPFEKVMGSVVVDRAMDVVCLLLVFCLALITDFDVLWSQISKSLSDQGESGITTWLWISMGIGLISIALLWIFREEVKKLSIYMKVRNKVAGFIEGIRSIGKLKSPILFIAHSLFIWFMFYLMTYLGFFAFAPTEHLSASAGLMVFIFGSLGIVIPSPGGMGTFHFLTGIALSLYGISAADSFSFANILFFSVQIFCNVFFGIIALIGLPLLNRNYTPAIVREEQEIIK